MELMATLILLGKMLSFLAVTAVLVGIYMITYSKWLTPFADKAQIKANNRAAATKVGAAGLAVILGTIGSLVMSAEPTYQQELQMFALDGSIAVVVMLLITYSMDWFVLRKVNNHSEIERENPAVARVEEAVYYGQGAITGASFAAAGGTLWQGIGSAVLFSILGQLSLVLVYWLFVLGHRLERVPSAPGDPANRKVRRNVEAEIAAGNMCTATEVSSTLLAVSIVVALSIIGPFQGWIQDIASYASAVLLGLLVITGLRELLELVSRRLGYGHNEATATVVGRLTIGFGALTGMLVFTL